MRMLFMLMISAMAAIAADVRAGAAAVKITPPKGAPMAGYYYNRAADGVHDDLAWVGLPGEIFTELGMMIKLASPFQYTRVASLANGSIGYVPDRKAYPQGAYEPVSARCAAGSGEMLVDAATRLLVEIHGHSR